MATTFAAIATVVVLAVWHWRTRRRAAWTLSADGRFYICLGYPMVAIAVYWLVNSPTATGWSWAVGNLWAIGAMVAFVLGFDALNAVTAQITSKAVARPKERVAVGPAHQDAPPASRRYWRLATRR